MSVRTFDFKVDGIQITITNGGGEKPARGASMSWKQAQRFVEEGKEMLAKKDEIKEEEWLNRTLRVVSESLQRAGAKIEASDLQDQFDIPTLNGMNDQILQMSGLRTAK